jgi:L-fucono-1,5-lactonase
MIIDAHHHLWELSRGDYGWIGGGVNPAVAAIERDYLLQEYVVLARQSGVAGSVVVQAAQTIDETRWLLAQARASDGFIRGVVGWVDMTHVDAPRALAELAQDRLLKSVRPMLQEIADADWVLQAQLDPAFRALIEHRLAFDLLIRPAHLQAALTILQRYPDLRAIVDHCAKPDIANGMWQPWADQMRRIGRDTRAYCKLSGLATEAGPNWTVDHLRRYVEHILDCFGVERVLWGSDWPVMLLNADYERWLDATEALLQALTPAERGRILWSNAIECYRLANRA